MAFSTEFSRHFSRVLVYTPNPEMTAKLFESSPEPKPANLGFAKLPCGPRKRFLRSKRKKCALGDVFADAESRMPGSQISGFVMWGYDLETAEMVSNPAARPWATLAGLSWHERKFNNAAAAREAGLVKLCQTTKECVRLLALENFTPPPPRRCGFRQYRTFNCRSNRHRWLIKSAHLLRTSFWFRRRVC